MSLLTEIDQLGQLLQPFIVELKEFEQLAHTPFRLNAMNGIYAPAKTGKTYFVLDQLNSLPEDEYNIVWLDADRNAEFKDKFSNVHHYPIGSTIGAFRTLASNKKRYDNFIFIIDSFKDFTFGNDTDTNMGCQTIFTEYQKLLDKGATLIIIFHATKLRSQDGAVYNFKIKGNEDVIESKMDFLYRFDRTNIYSKLTVQCARDVTMKKNDIITFADNNYVAKKIREIVNNQPEITLRELKRAPGMSGLEQKIIEFKDIVYTCELIPAQGRGKPRNVIKLI